MLAGRLLLPLRLGNTLDYVARITLQGKTGVHATAGRDGRCNNLRSRFLLLSHISKLLKQL